MPRRAYGDVAAWGSWFGPSPNVPRSALGTDAKGNVLYVATMDPVSVHQLARALISAGAIEAVELDINPFWPILGMSRHRLHHITQRFGFSLPGSKHRPEVLSTGWSRDFFVVMAEPSSPHCRILTNRVGQPGHKVSHYVRLSGKGCPRTKH